jgi:hypothetical protein
MDVANTIVGMALLVTSPIFVNLQRYATSKSQHFVSAKAMRNGYDQRLRHGASRQRFRLHIVTALHALITLGTRGRRPARARRKWSHAVGRMWRPLWGSYAGGLANGNRYFPKCAPLVILGDQAIQGLAELYGDDKIVLAMHHQHRAGLVATLTACFTVSSAAWATSQTNPRR